MYAELRAALKRNGHYETLRLRERSELKPELKSESKVELREKERKVKGVERECVSMEVETGKRESEEWRDGLDVEREWSVWRNSELDGFWFFVPEYEYMAQPVAVAQGNEDEVNIACWGEDKEEVVRVLNEWIEREEKRRKAE